MTEEKDFKYVLIFCWLLPFFAAFFLYLLKPKFLSEKSKFVVWQLLNKQFNMSLVYLSLITGLNKAMYFKEPKIAVYRILIITILILIFSIIRQAQYTYKWLNGDFKKYKYVFYLFNKI